MHIEDLGYRKFNHAVLYAVLHGRLDSSEKQPLNNAKNLRHGIEQEQ